MKPLGPWTAEESHERHQYDAVTKSLYVQKMEVWHKYEYVREGRPGHVVNSSGVPAELPKGSLPVTDVVNQRRESGIQYLKERRLSQSDISMVRSKKNYKG